MRHFKTWLAIALVALTILTACGSGDGSLAEEGVADVPPELTAVSLDEGEKLRVVATTTIVGNVVQVIGGDAIDLTVLLPVGVDPHTFEPAPQDMAAVADAHVIFVNGAGLEVFLDRLLRNAGSNAAVVNVSDGIRTRRLEDEAPDADHGEDEEVDPHVWFNPLNVVVWTGHIEKALSTLNPANSGVYETNARAYRMALQELDVWIVDQVDQVPQIHRRLVTDHATFGYFADHYGFEQMGTVFPGFSSAAEPSARDLAELTDTIRELGVPAIFVGTTVNPGLAQRIADDTGTQVVSLYTGSLSGPDGPAGDYLTLMRYNVSTIVNALK